MNSSLLAKEELRLLAKYDTPTVCNVIELFDVRPRNSGYMERSIKACFPDLPPIVGYAATATFRASTPPTSGDAYTTLDTQIAALAEIPSPPIIVFEDLDDPPAAATFGEIMCTTYQRFGAAGLITSGAGRDLDQVYALKFPVFTSGAICAHGYCQFPSIHVPVCVGGITVKPGDLLHADRNGVTTIPAAIASEVAPACAEFVRAEAVILEYLQSEQVSVKGLAAACAECDRLIEELKKQISSRQLRGGKRENS
ncbi:RraA family protein [Candidatus Sumerlaeota bacterium]